MRFLFFLALLSPATFGQTLVVSNRGDDTVQLYDVQERRSIGVHHVGVGAHEFAVSPDGRTVVGACYGSGPMHAVPDQRLVVIKLDDPSKPVLVDLGDNPRPNDLAFAGEDQLIVTSEVKQRLLLLDTETWKVERELPVGLPGGHMLALDLTKKRAYVPSVHTGKLAFVDFQIAESEVPRIQVPVGRGSEDVALSPRGDALWVTCHQAGRISVVDTASHQVVQEIEADGAPFRAAFTPDGTRVVVAHPMAHEVRIYSAEKHSLLKRISIPNGAPTSLAIDAEGTHAFAVCGPLQKVVMLDLESAEVVYEFATGPGPDALAVSSHLPAKKER